MKQASELFSQHAEFLRDRAIADNVSASHSPRQARVLAEAVVVVAEGIAARTTGAELRSATLVDGKAAG